MAHKIDEKDCAASDTIAASPAANDFPAVVSAVGPAMRAVNPAVGPAIAIDVSERGACVRDARPAGEPDSGGDVPSTFEWDPGPPTGDTIEAAVGVEAAIDVRSGSAGSGTGSSVVLQNSSQPLPGLVCVNAFAQAPDIDAAMPADHTVALGVSERTAAMPNTAPAGELDQSVPQSCGVDAGSGTDPPVFAPEFEFAWDPGQTAAATVNDAAGRPHKSDGSRGGAIDFGAAYSDRTAPFSGASLSTVLESTLPKWPAQANPRSGPKRANRKAVVKLRTLVGLHAAVRALLRCRKCGQRGHTLDCARLVLGVDVLLGCPYESCTLCGKPDHAARDCRSPEPEDLQSLVNQWMYAPWLQHSDAESCLASTQAENARLRSELLQHTPKQDGRLALLTMHTVVRASTDVPPVPGERTTKFGSAQDVAGQPDSTTGLRRLQDFEAKRRNERSGKTAPRAGLGFDFDFEP